MGGAFVMPLEKVTDREGCWYLRYWQDDLRAVRLVSERAQAGTLAADLKPGCVEIDGDEETLSIAVEALREFVVWPPCDGESS